MDVARNHMVYGLITRGQAQRCNQQTQEAYPNTKGGVRRGNATTVGFRVYLYLTSTSNKIGVSGDENYCGVSV
jgi:hypothetical protein